MTFKRGRNYTHIFAPCWTDQRMSPLHSSPFCLQKMQKGSQTFFISIVSFSNKIFTYFKSKYNILCLPSSKMMKSTFFNFYLLVIVQLSCCCRFKCLYSIMISLKKISLKIISLNNTYVRRSLFIVLACRTNLKFR